MSAPRKKKVINILLKRMYEVGYKDVTEFAKRSGVGLSFETCRRAMLEDKQNIRLEYVVKIMRFLDFNINDIGSELLRRGDDNLIHLISDSAKGVVLNKQEKEIIDSIRKHNKLIPIFKSIAELTK